MWIDCEMTGLDLGRDRLIEIACLVTGPDLSVLGEGVDLVVGAPAESLTGLVPVVAEMHTRSGLLAEAAASRVSLAEAEEQVLDYVRAHVPQPGTAPLCGNSIATDRAFLARDMPTLDGWLHYRMIDVSAVKELARRWFPAAYRAAPPKRGGHRALADIRESIRELDYYRRTVFAPAPGPDAEQAAAVAAELAGATAGATDGAADGSAGGSETGTATAVGGAGEQTPR